MSKSERSNIYNVCNSYFKKHITGNVAIGISGGSDSLACLVCLLDYIESKKLKIEVHGIMILDNIQEEKDNLMSWCQTITQKHSFFFLHIIRSEVTNKMISQKQKCNQVLWREEKYNNFKKIYDTYKCTLLVIAHHADDVAETVLKRIFENSFLSKLYGMTEYSNTFGMDILRPLLSVKKKSLIDFCHFMKIPFFKESKIINGYSFSDMYSDTRVAIREKILPFINDNFMKDVSKPLVKIAKQSHILNDYLSKKTKTCISNIETINKKLFIKREYIEPLHTMEIIFVLRHIASIQNVNISFEGVLEAAEFVKESKRKLVSFHKGFIIIDKKGVHISLGKT